MTAEESVRAGRLEEALTELQAQVRKQPADPKLRIFLFQLLSVMGQWDRALTQLKVAGEMDANAATMMATYKEVIRCEVLRAEVFAGKQTPLLFGKPAEWMALLVEALRLSRRAEVSGGGEAARAGARGRPHDIGLGQSTEPFELDQRRRPADRARCWKRSSTGRYYWIPFARLPEVRIEKPADLRDIAWTPAYLMLANGGETVG